MTSFATALGRNRARQLQSSICLPAAASMPRSATVLCRYQARQGGKGIVAEEAPDSPCAVPPASAQTVWLGCRMAAISTG